MSLFSKAYKQRNGLLQSKKLNVTEILSESNGKAAKDPFASKEEVEELDFFEDFDNDQDRLSGKGVNNKFKKLAKLIRPVGLVSKGR